MDSFQNPNLVSSHKRSVLSWMPKYQPVNVTSGKRSFGAWCLWARDDAFASARMSVTAPLDASCDPNKKPLAPASPGIVVTVSHFSISSWCTTLQSIRHHGLLNVCYLWQTDDPKPVGVNWIKTKWKHSRTWLDTIMKQSAKAHEIWNREI